MIAGSLAKYTADDSNQFRTLVQFDCRGVEPVEFSPSQPWKAEGADSGSRFAAINLEEGDWADYDEKAADSVGIYELSGQFVKLRN